MKRTHENFATPRAAFSSRARALALTLATRQLFKTQPTFYFLSTPPHFPNPQTSTIILPPNSQIRPTMEPPSPVSTQPTVPKEILNSNIYQLALSTVNSQKAVFLATTTLTAEQRKLGLHIFDQFVKRCSIGIDVICTAEDMIAVLDLAIARMLAEKQTSVDSRLLTAKDKDAVGARRKGRPKAKGGVKGSTSTPSAEFFVQADDETELDALRHHVDWMQQKLRHEAGHRTAATPSATVRRNQLQAEVDKAKNKFTRALEQARETAEAKAANQLPAKRVPQSAKAQRSTQVANTRANLKHNLADDTEAQPNPKRANKRYTLVCRLRVSIPANFFTSPEYKKYLESANEQCTEIAAAAEMRENQDSCKMGSTNSGNSNSVTTASGTFTDGMDAESDLINATDASAPRPKDPKTDANPVNKKGSSVSFESSLPPFPRVPVNLIGDFKSGALMALENIREDHQESPTSTLLELVKILEEEQPTFEYNENDRRVVTLKGAVYVYEILKGICEDRKGEWLALSRVCGPLEEMVEKYGGRTAGWWNENEESE
jgi:hypothetical protein